MNPSDLLEESLRTIDKMDGDPLGRELYRRANPSLDELLAEDEQLNERVFRAGDLRMDVTPNHIKVTQVYRGGSDELGRYLGKDAMDRWEKEIKDLERAGEKEMARNLSDLLKQARGMSESVQIDEASKADKLSKAWGDWDLKTIKRMDILDTKLMQDLERVMELDPDQWTKKDHDIQRIAGERLKSAVDTLRKLKSESDESAHQLGEGVVYSGEDVQKQYRDKIAPAVTGMKAIASKRESREAVKGDVHLAELRRLAEDELHEAAKKIQRLVEKGDYSSLYDVVTDTLKLFPSKTNRLLGDMDRAGLKRLAEKLADYRQAIWHMKNMLEDVLKESVQLSEARKITVRDLERTMGNVVRPDEPGALEELAKELNRGANKRKVDDLMQKANDVLEGFGVEALQPEDAWVDNYWRDTVALYVNMGSTYAPTVVYDTETGDFMVTSWGDFLEGWEQEQVEAVLIDGEIVTEARRIRRAIKRGKGSVRKLVRQKRTSAKKKRKSKRYRKSAKGRLAKFRRKLKDKYSAAKKKAKAITKRAQKRYYGRSMGDDEVDGMSEESVDILNRIESELEESAPRYTEPSARMTPWFGGVTKLNDPGTLGYDRDTTTAPRATIEFGSPIMPYLDNLSLSGELALKLAEMSRDEVVADRLVEFAMHCDEMVRDVRENGYTDRDYDGIRSAAHEASGIATDALRQFEELGYFEEGKGRAPKAKKAAGRGEKKIHRKGEEEDE